MQIFKEITSVDFINSDSTIRKNVEILEDSELLELGIDFYLKNKNCENCLVHKFVKDDKSSIIKIFTKNFNKLVLNSDEGSLFSIIIDESRVNYPCVFRLTQKKNDELEVIIHENNLNAHEDEILDSLSKLSKTSLYKKPVVEKFYLNKKSKIINSNLITIDYQIFNTGNIIHDEDELGV